MDWITRANSTRARYCSYPSAFVTAAETTARRLPKFTSWSSPRPLHFGFNRWLARDRESCAEPRLGIRLAKTELVLGHHRAVDLIVAFDDLEDLGVTEMTADRIFV